MILIGELTVEVEGELESELDVDTLFRLSRAASLCSCLYFPMVAKYGTRPIGRLSDKRGYVTESDVELCPTWTSSEMERGQVVGRADVFPPVCPGQRARG